MRRGTKLTLGALVAAIALSAPATSVAAEITVDTLDDELGDGTDCSLREAVEAANTNAIVDDCPGGDLGLDAITLPAGPIVLSLGAAGEDANQGGDLDITESVSISGQGAGSTCAVAGSSCIDADDLDRALDLRDGAAPVAVTLTGLTIADGMVAGDGGAVISEQGDASVALSGATIASSEASLDGGAIRSLGPVAISGSLLEDNMAGRGGALSQGGSTLAITGSVLNTNTATGATGGGAVAADTGASVSIGAGKLAGNGAAAGAGGAILSAGASLTVSESTFEANFALTGGALASTAGATISGSTFSANTANGSCMLGGGDGGAIDHRPVSGALTITNSTIASNIAGCAGGAVSVFDTASATTLVHATVAGNTALSAGGGIRNEADLTGASPVTLRASIVAENPGGNCGGDGTRITAGHNIESTDSCGLSFASFDLASTDPALGPPRFNGGPTRTQLPFTSSPAINAIGSGCPAPDTDQRGVGRPVAGRCDIGAVEVSPGPLCAGATATIAGTPGIDAIAGTVGRDVIAGLGGNDRIKGLRGNDSICGGPGADALIGGKGNDKLRGESGADALFGGPGKDLLEGGPGKDRLKGGPGKNKLKQ